MPEFTAQIIQLAQLFAHPYLIEAPAYQRAYAWTPREAGQLLEDVGSAAEHGGEAEDYFLGAMLFIDRNGAARPSRWRAEPARLLEVVDGFQRLTTLTILFCVLRDLGVGPGHRRLAAAIEASSEAGGRARLTLGTPDEAFFATHVRARGATGGDVETQELSPAEKRIVDVRDHLRAALAEYDLAQRRRLIDFVLDRCCVVLVATTGIDRAHRMFTVLNATGKPLARNDVLKAALLGSVPATQAPAARAAWSDAETRLGENFEALFSHIHAIHGRPGGRVISGVMEIAAASGGARSFIEETVRPAALVFDDLLHARHEGSPHSAAIARHLHYLGWHSFADWIPPAMLFQLTRGNDAAELAWFLGALDRLAFAIRILAAGSTKRIGRFGAVVTAIRNGRDLRASDSPLAIQRQEQRAIQHNLRELHARNPPAAKHLLLRINDAIAGDLQSAPLLSDMTVEHVLPRKLTGRSQWRAWFPDPEEREQCTESLGNLVLVTKAQNDKAGNLDFARKHEVYFNTPGAPLLLINEDLRGRSDWTPEQIKSREAKLLRQVEGLWSFNMVGVPGALSEPGRSEPARERRRA